MNEKSKKEMTKCVNRRIRLDNQPLFGKIKKTIKVRTRETTEIELIDACKIKIVTKRKEKESKQKKSNTTEIIQQ